MNKSIAVILPEESFNESADFVYLLKSEHSVKQVFVYGKKRELTNQKFRHFDFDDIISSESFTQLAKLCNADYLLLIKDKTRIIPGQFAIERFVSVAETANAGLVYSDYLELKDNQQKLHPLNDYQSGSVRDDFDFGPMLLIDAKVLNRITSENKQNLEYSAFYNLRLKISLTHKIIRIPEFLYTVKQPETRKSGDALFDYVDSRNRLKQIEAEQVFTQYLKEIGAWLKPVFKEPDFNSQQFPVIASVIIPVKNRAKTISDAVKSVLNQRTSFEFNLIVIDNHSSDGTTQILENIAINNKKLIHIIPERKDLGIGGCWNEGVHHPACGMFAVQLDSDDIYKDEFTLQKIVDAFYQQNCAMVVGTYQLVNFKLEEIPPGMIEHKEWTPENGRNNALRINGLGAPRAFYTPLLRELKIPNVSYGEDYAIGLAISRNYQIGRIYENLYLCRRWEENSDASLDIEKQNRYNHYKDWIRTIEIQSRKKMISDNS